MRNRKNRWQYAMVAMLMGVLALAMVGITEPGVAQAANFGGPTDNGTANYMTANWMGIGTTAPTKILHVTGTGPGTVPLFQRASDSAGFIIERTPTNRWVLGVNESPTLGNGFVLSTIPTGTTSIPRLLVMQDGRVGINTITPDAGAKLTVVNDNATTGASAIYAQETAGADTAAIIGRYGTPGSGTRGLLGATQVGVYGVNETANNHGFMGGSDYGVKGESSSGNFGYLGQGSYGVHGVAGSGSSTGVYGETSSGNGYGVSGKNTGSGSGSGMYGESASNPGVAGNNTGSGIGVRGESSSGTGVRGTNTSSLNYGYLGDADYGVFGHGRGASGRGVWGENENYSNSGYIGSNLYGVYGYSGEATGYAVWGQRGGVGSPPYGYLGGTNNGAYGETNSGAGYGVYGKNNSSGPGVYGESLLGNGVEGKTTGSGYGVYGRYSTSGPYGYVGASNFGVYGKAGDSGPSGYLGGSSNGVFGSASPGLYAGFFSGDVNVTGTLTSGTKDFKIDHPLDPENKYLVHSVVESPDIKNIYDGIALLDDKGEATVELPSYFEALNRDFRYQLTCIGGYAPVYVADEAAGNQFKISGGKPGLKVSWMVTGIRQDAYANAHPIVVEQEKPANEKGLYLHPTEWGQPREKGISQLNK